MLEANRPVEAKDETSGEGSTTTKTKPETTPAKPPTCAVPNAISHPELAIELPKSVKAGEAFSVTVKHKSVGLTHIVLTTCDASGAVTYAKANVVRNQAPFEWRFDGVKVKGGATQIAVEADPAEKIQGTVEVMAP